VVVRQLGRLGAVQPSADAATVVGVHAEGPFLSEHHRGVHRPVHLRDPDIGLLQRFLAAGPLRTITIAPELPGALEVIRWAAAQGIIVQAGHSGADAATSHAAFDAGARAVTHLFNGMITFRHRDPGIAGATLARADVSIQLIADDIHLAPETSVAALRAAEDRTMLVTDASAAAGAGDGQVTAGGFVLTVVDGVPRLPDGTLAGSTVRLLQQIRKLIERGWPVDRAANLASRSPARFFGLVGRGELLVGGPADLLVTDEHLKLERVLLAGQEVAR
jgi:N-acetylglucosamine-6-phosphate deacetylase